MDGFFAGVFDPQAGRGTVAPGPLRALEPGDGPADKHGPLTVIRSEAPQVSAAVADGILCLVAGRLDAIAGIADDVGVMPQQDAARALVGAWRRRGATLLERLRGTFAIVVWDEDTSRGIVAVDQMGAASLFYRSEDDRLFFASEVRDLLRMLPRRPAPDRVSIVHWLTKGANERGRTLYEGIRRLEGGHYIAFSRDGWNKSRYWAPSFAQPTRVARPDAVNAVADQVSLAIARRWSGRSRTGILLSGGLDSSTIAGTLTRLSRGSADVRSYSAFFPAHPSMDETAVIERVTQELRLPSNRLFVERGSMLAASLEFLRAWEVPSVSPNLFFGLPLARYAADDGIATLFDGEGGDELFGAAPYLLADRVRSGRFLSLFRLAAALLRDHPERDRAARALAREYGLTGALPPAIHRAARRLRGPSHYAPKWLTAESAQLYADIDQRWTWKAAAGPRWWAHLVDVLVGARERVGAHDFLRRKAALAGVEGAHPFLEDLDLIEFVLGLPPELSFDGRCDRPLLRDSMDGVVPDAARLRTDKTDFMPLFVDCLMGPDRAMILRLLDDPHAEVNAFVRPDVVKEQLLGPPPEWQRGAWAWSLWRLVTAECWLRLQLDDAFPSKMLDGRGLKPRQEVLEVHRSLP